MFGLMKRIFALIPALVGVGLGAAAVIWGFYAVDVHCEGGAFVGWYQVVLFAGAAFVGIGAISALASIFVGSGERVWSAVLTPFVVAALIAAAPYVPKIPAVSIPLGGVPICAAGR